ncbi:MAG TPA: 30S ribosomal protein S1 [Solirubrobacteraceae bacterium]|nr:30S ribosomal protein S1 [Solirubrobacteraceae bacterium]
MPTADQPNAKVVEGSNGLLLEIDGQIVPNYDATLHPFGEGDVVTGHVVRIDNDEVLVDIGYKSEGVIPASELSIRKSVDPSDEVSLGEEVDALVLTKEDQDGRLILSKKRARFEKAWRRIEAAAESGEPVTGTVIEVVKGGLIIDLGVRGFLPASLVDIRRVPNLDEYMSQDIECKVIELNRSRNNVVLSRRAVLEEQRKEDRERILDRLQPGQVVEGTISNIVDFGAFVDLDGIDGLIHISELSWSHVNHPSEILNIGDTVSVKVLDIDRQRQRISLGLKQTQEDPWQRVVDTYNINDELEGTVTKVVTFGAFVEILDGVEGLVHISELAQHHVENPREIIQPGDPVRVKILEIDSERRRLSLSIKRVEGQVLPVRPIVPPAEGDAGLDDVPELGLSEDVFADAGSASASEASAAGVEDETVTEPDTTRAADSSDTDAAPPSEDVTDESTTEPAAETAPEEPEAVAETAPEEPEGAAETASADPEAAAETAPAQPEAAAETASADSEAAAETTPAEPEAAAETAPAEPEAVVEPEAAAGPEANGAVAGSDSEPAEQPSS